MKGNGRKGEWAEGKSGGKEIDKREMDEGNGRKCIDGREWAIRGKER